MVLVLVEVGVRCGGVLGGPPHEAVVVPAERLGPGRGVGLGVVGAG